MIEDTTTLVPNNPILWTVRTVLEAAENFLRRKGSPSPRLDAEVLLSDCLKCERISLILDSKRPLTIEERADFRSQITKRSLGEPVAYLTGSKAFWRYDFKVNRDVLIPRPETELLVELVTAKLQKLSTDNMHAVLDIGTVSGCIAISIAKECSNAQVFAWDVSHRALAVARENAVTLGAEVEFSHQDMRALSTWGIFQTFDVVVANPPYISQSETNSVDASVLNFEPHLALFASNEGYGFFEILAENVKRILNGDGEIFLEVGASQAERVCAILSANGWLNVTVKKDLSGHNRVVAAQVASAAENMVRT